MIFAGIAGTVEDTGSMRKGSNPRLRIDAKLQEPKIKCEEEDQHLAWKDVQEHETSFQRSLVPTVTSEGRMQWMMHLIILARHDGQLCRTSQPKGHGSQTCP